MGTAIVSQTLFVKLFRPNVLRDMFAYRDILNADVYEADAWESNIRGQGRDIVKLLQPRSLLLG